jgi:hypothetical protein
MVKERFAGVDWASEEHAVCVVDERGRIVDGRRYRHDEPGIRALCARLLKFGVALVALERPDGLLTWRLLDAGLSVIAVHPNQVRAMRPRYSVAGGKSDGFDSFVLAELARTDHHRFRILVPDSDRTKALRAMTCSREDLVRTRVALANQLRDQLACFWPGAGMVFSAIDSPISLAFLRRYPGPADARGLGEQRMAAFLARQGYNGRKPARELLALLRNGAEGRAGELESHARRQVVLALVSALEPVVAKISELTSASTICRRAAKPSGSRAIRAEAAGCTCTRETVGTVAPSLRLSPLCPRAPTNEAVGAQAAMTNELNCPASSSTAPCSLGTSCTIPSVPGPAAGKSPPASSPGAWQWRRSRPARRRRARPGPSIPGRVPREG